MSLDPLTGLPVDFVRMLVVKVDPYADRKTFPAGEVSSRNPNKPLDDFFAALVRAQSFRAPARKAVGTDLDGNQRPEEGRSP